MRTTKIQSLPGSLERSESFKKKEEDPDATSTSSSHEDTVETSTGDSNEGAGSATARFRDEAPSFREAVTANDDDGQRGCGDDRACRSGDHHQLHAEESKVEGCVADNDASGGDRIPLLNPEVWRHHLKEKMYSRNSEQAELLDCFHRLRRAATAELLLISGPSGSGKTSLAKTLRRPTEEMGGYFLAGKYDQLSKPYPYAGYVAAFTTFARQVRERGQGAVMSVRGAVRDAVGDEAAVLIGMIPALEAILGCCSEPTKCQATTSDAIPRFVSVFRRFIKAVCAPDRPLVLLLEDIHWADPCSLDVLSSLVLDEQIDGLVLIGTCDVVPVDSYLSTKLRELEDKRNAVVTHTSLQNLGKDAVKDLLCEVLQLDPDSCESLTEIVIQQSCGNPAFLVDFLRWIQENGLLYFDRGMGSWRWNAHEIDLMIDVNRVGSFLVDKIEQLPVHVRDVLKVSSCLGPHLDMELLEYVLGVPEKAVERAVVEAVQSGVISNDDSGGYVFQHDKIQSAAYDLIEDWERELFHLEVGRRMWRRLTSEEELDRHLFTLLSQINIGWRLISREREQCAVAHLCLRAGTKAAKSSAFRTALTYLELGISLLGPRSWRDHYDLTLALYNATAEMCVCRANFERMNELVKVVLNNAHCLTDKTQAYATCIYALGVSEKQSEAVAMALDVLKGFGEALPAKPSRFQVGLEFKRVQRLLRGKSDPQLLRMPRMVDKEKLACMQILYLAYLSTLFSNHQTLMPIIVLKMVRVFSSAAFAYYGIVCVMARSDIDSALRFGSLGVKFLDLYKAKEFLPRVYAAYYGFIHPWKASVKESLEPLLLAHKIGLQTGDMEGAFICSNLYCLVASEAGTPLGTIDRQWAGFQEAMVATRHRTLLTYSMPKVQLIHHQMGLTKDPLSPIGDILDYDDVINSATENGHEATALVARLSRMFLAYTFNDLDLAENMARELKYLERIPLCIVRIFTNYIRGLVFLSCARDGRKARKNIRTAKKVIKSFEHWAVLSPHNCLDKLFLLQAELASVRGKNAEANSKFVAAVACAKNSGFPFTAALAAEQTARHFLRLADTSTARPYFEEACRYYREWGGTVKVNKLEAEIRTL